MINPPSSSKYGYWTNGKRPAKPETWLATARQHEGSWWPDWAAWLAKKSGAQVPAREPGAGGLPALEPAPGAFVKVRAAD